MRGELGRKLAASFGAVLAVLLLGGAAPPPATAAVKDVVIAMMARVPPGSMIDVAGDRFTPALKPDAYPICSATVHDACNQPGSAKDERPR